MGQTFFTGRGLTENQALAFRLSVSAACRKMTADQILDLADHLHAIIRKRGASVMHASSGVRPWRFAAAQPCQEMVQ